MTFKVNNFSYDETAKRATVNLTNNKGDFLGFTFNLPSSPSETLGAIKHKALHAIEEMVGRAIRDALHEVERPHDGQHHHG
ncbi:MAG: hypothetical protein ABF888_00100 [Acetobacter papayae]